MRTANQVSPNAMTSVRLWAASVRSARLLAKMPAPASMMTKASVSTRESKRRCVVCFEASRKWECVWGVLGSIIALTNLPIHVLRVPAQGDRVLPHDRHRAHRKPAAHPFGCEQAATDVSLATGEIQPTLSFPAAMRAHRHSVRHRAKRK